MNRYIYAMVLMALPGLANAADVYTCTMTGNRIGSVLTITIDESARTATVLDPAFIGETVPATYRQVRGNEAQLRWRYRVTTRWGFRDTNYHASLDKSSGRIRVTILAEDVDDIAVSYGASGQCRR